MTKKPDWDAYAVAMANRALKTFGRGVRSVALDQVVESKVVLRLDSSGRALPADNRGLGVAVVFGTDGYLQSAKVRALVHVVRRCLALKGIEALGFGANDTGQPVGAAWALVARSDEPRLLGAILNAAHPHAFGKGTAAEVVAACMLAELGIDAADIPVNFASFAG